MRPITASATGRILACRYPLRADVELPAEEPSESAAAGTAMHAELAAALSGTLPADAKLSAKSEALLHWLSWLTNARSAVVESAYAWDGEHARFLGFGRASYVRAPTAIVCGTLDVSLALGGGVRRVIEWKSSAQSAEQAGPQLATQAALLLTASTGEQIRMVAVAPLDDGSVHVVEHGTMDRLDAALHLAHLAELRTDTEPHPGEHCTKYYCPLVGRCPAYVEAGAKAAELLPVSALLPRGRNPLTEGVFTDEDAAAVVLLAPLLEKRLELLVEQARARTVALGGRLPLPDGRAYAQVYRSKTSLSAKKLAALAASLGATPEQLGACSSDGSHFAWTILGKKKEK